MSNADSPGWAHYDPQTNRARLQDPAFAVVPAPGGRGRLELWGRWALTALWLEAENLHHSRGHSILILILTLILSPFRNHSSTQYWNTLVLSWSTVSIHWMRIVYPYC